MPRVPVIQFPGYRRFDSARIEVNDATMALLIGSRLAAHLLSASTGSSAYLPEIYPSVDGIRRLHLRPDTASALLRDVESHLAAMAIPYIWATFEVLLNETSDLLGRDQKPSPTAVEKKDGMKGLLTYIGRVTSSPLDPDDVALLDLVRHIRICIVHYGSRPGSKVRNAWNLLSIPQHDRWVRYANRPLPLTGSVIDIRNDEVVASLAIAKHAARQIGERLTTSISPATWAEEIVDDYLSNGVNPPSDPVLRRKKLKGWARLFYESAKVPQSLLDAALVARQL